MEVLYIVLYTHNASLSFIAQCSLCIHYFLQNLLHLIILHLYLITYLGMISCRNLVSHPIFGQQIFKPMISETCAIITNNGSWSSKLCEYLIFHKLNNYFGVIYRECCGFHPLGNIVYYH